MRRREKAALFIDGQNMWPFEYAAMHEAVQKYNTMIKRVYLSRVDVDYYKNYKGRKIDIVASLQNRGFETIVTGHLKNVDPYLIADVMEVICERPDIENIILSTGDTDLVRVVDKAKERGRNTILITKKEQKGVSAALKKRVHLHIEIPNVLGGLEDN